MYFLRNQNKTLKMLKTGPDNELANNLEAYSTYNMYTYVEFTCTFEI